MEKLDDARSTQNSDGSSRSPRRHGVVGIAAAALAGAGLVIGAAVAVAAPGATAVPAAAPAAKSVAAPSVSVPAKQPALTRSPRAVEKKPALTRAIRSVAPAAAPAVAPASGDDDALPEFRYNSSDGSYTGYNGWKVHSKDQDGVRTFYAVHEIRSIDGKAGGTATTPFATRQLKSDSPAGSDDDWIPEYRYDESTGRYSGYNGWIVRTENVGPTRTVYAELGTKSDDGSPGLVRTVIATENLYG
jgi:hypothetical protein